MEFHQTSGQFKTINYIRIRHAQYTIRPAKYGIRRKALVLPPVFGYFHTDLFQHDSRTMANFIHSPVGALHVGAAVVALLLGTLVFLNTKATQRHKRLGYAYVFSMVVLNGTAFQIYALFGRFGPFHYMAIFSLFSIMAGTLPVILKRPAGGSWLQLHYYFMNWSVVGLYAAFWAETLVRFFPMRQFWPVVVLATISTTLTGSYLIRKHQKRLLSAHQKQIISFNQTDHELL
ncbi:DUF2306 domain-containing protein [Fibrella aquatica]|uniref:DUF2306 domain-containing protein n=1 Tax=Fibrella aquatica TaxID=3242487 RepID=UPI003520F81C